MVTTGKDTICVVSASPAEAEALRQAIDLRGVEEIYVADFDQAADVVNTYQPPLVIVDAEDKYQQALELLETLPDQTSRLVIASAFNEEFFLSAHELRVRDYLVKPVPDAYLISRILLAFEERHQQILAERNNDLLRDLNVITDDTGVFTTHYFIRMLKQETEKLILTPDSTISLLILETGGYPYPLPSLLRQELNRNIVSILKSCARGSDILGELFEDKFAVILPGTSARGAKSLAGRVFEKLQQMRLSDPELSGQLAARIGYADYDDCRHYEDLLNKTLEHMRRAGEKTAVT